MRHILDLRSWVFHFLKCIAPPKADILNASRSKPAMEQLLAAGVGGHAFAFERYQQSFKTVNSCTMSTAFWNVFNTSYFTSPQLRLDVAVEFCSLMSRLAIMTITFKHLLNSSAYTLPVWAMCEDFPVVAHVSSSCYVASTSEANTHT